MWDVQVLEELCDILREVSPNSQFLWNNQVLVRMYTEGKRDPWVGISTKRPDAVVLSLTGPKGAVPLGRITELARDRELDESKEDYDVVKLKFRAVQDLQRSDLVEFLKEHHSNLARAAV
jgi:hypothetical protein